MASTNRRGDDRILAPTRWTAWLVAPVLLAAGVILYGAPGDTEDLWAWTIRPEMTALAVGGGYAAGATFFVRGALSSRWHRLRVGFAGAGVLSSLLLVATLIHWENFDHDHVSFWAWLGLYVITPFLLPALLVLNDRHDPGMVGGPVVPRPIALAVGVVGVVQVSIALAMFVVPAPFFDIWPWQLTALTARTLAAFVAFIGVMWLAFLVERRWSALELVTQSAWLGLALVAVAAVWQRDDITSRGAATTALFAVVLGGMLVGILVLQVAMARRDHQPGNTRSPRSRSGSSITG